MTLYGGCNVTAPHGIDPMEESQLEIGWDQFLRLLLPQSSYPRSLWMLASKVNILVVGRSDLNIKICERWNSMISQVFGNTLTGGLLLK